MSRHAPKPMRSRIPQQLREERPLHALADPSWRRCNSPSIPLPQYRPFAWRDAEDDAKHWNVWFTRSLLLQPEARQTTGHGSTAVWLHRHPSTATFQMGVSIEHHFSCIFPAHPRSLARCLSRARRHGASLLRFHRPAGFGFQKIFCATNAKRFSEPSEKGTAWPWERGTLASLRARVSRG